MARGVEKGLDPAEVIFFSDLQTMISRRPRGLPRRISKICGVDAAYDDGRVFAAACVFEGGKPSAESLYVGTCALPYVSGLFYLREGPFAVEAVRRLKVRPELVCFDAHGVAHPRRAGLATICGKVLGIPSMGIAKSRLVGTVLAGTEGKGRLVEEGGKTLGFVTTMGRSARYWSPGYSVSLPSLERIMSTQAHECLEAVRRADIMARRARVGFPLRP